MNEVADGVISQVGVYPLPGFYEPFGAMSHLVGAVVFLILGVMLLRRGAGSASRSISLGIYAFSCVFLMSMSGIYHMMVDGGAAHTVMCRLDHSAIFILFAGTFTPTHSILFRGWRRYGPLAFIWVGAIAGITLKTVFFDSVPQWLGLALYLGLGSVGVISGVMIYRRYGAGLIAPLACGAVAYTAGGIAGFLGWPILIARVIEGHEVFHLAVLAGAISHWRFIWRFADGKAQPRVESVASLARFKPAVSPLVPPSTCAMQSGLTAEGAPR